MRDKMRVGRSPALIFRGRRRVFCYRLGMRVITSLVCA
jgi:hypothetical protein